MTDEDVTIRRPSGTLGHGRLEAPEINPSSQEYLLGGVYPSPYPTLAIPPNVCAVSEKILTPKHP